MKLANKFMVFLMLITLTLSFAVMDTNPGICAAGTTGNIETSYDEMPANTVVSISLSGLTVSASYDITFTTGSYTGNLSFTTSSTQTEKVFNVKLSKPSSGDMCAIALCGDEGPVIDSTEVRIVDPDDFLGTDFLVDLLPSLLLVIIIVVIIGGILGGAFFYKME